jgi:acrylyl-CoA reductase (NADPH)
MFKALMLEKSDDRFSARLANCQESELPEPERAVLVAVEFSTLNYKDALAITNRSPVVRRWPMVPGIDGAGAVLDSSDARWPIGARVVLNGFGVGETHWGCLAQRACLSGDWLVAIPDALTSFECMAIGTAGYTAMLCVLALADQGVTPAHGPILVTGSSGGVGSFSIALLAARGYQVVASSGKAHEAEYLKGLGAAEVIERTSLSEPGKPLQKERFAGVIDSVGSHTLANACAQTRYGGVVAACGLAQGMDFPASVAPFILRAVRLIGIDSVMAPLAARQRAWQALADELAQKTLSSIAARTVALEQSITAAADLMAQRVTGRVVVDVNG